MTSIEQGRRAAPVIAEAIAERGVAFVYVALLYEQGKARRWALAQRDDIAQEIRVLFADDVKGLQLVDGPAGYVVLAANRQDELAFLRRVPELARILELEPTVWEKAPKKARAPKKPAAAGKMQGSKRSIHPPAAAPRADQGRKRSSKAIASSADMQSTGGKKAGPKKPAGKGKRRD